MQELCKPPGGVLGSVVEDAVLDALKYHAICTFNLVVAASVRHRSVIDVDEAVLSNNQKSDPVKVEPRSATILLGAPK
jgi:hypothetical protein